MIRRKHMSQLSGSQNGSAIIMLFVAVGLFAALAYAFMQNSQTSTSMMTEEIAKAEESKNQAYTNSIAMAVKRLKIRGCAESEISYETPKGHNSNPDAPADLRCHIFKIQGGGLEFQGDDVPPIITYHCGAFTPSIRCEVATPLFATTTTTTVAECIDFCESTPPPIPGNPICCQRMNTGACNMKQTTVTEPTVPAANATICTAS